MKSCQCGICLSCIWGDVLVGCQFRADVTEFKLKPHGHNTPPPCVALTMGHSFPPSTMLSGDIVRTAGYSWKVRGPWMFKPGLITKWYVRFCKNSGTWKCNWRKWTGLLPYLTHGLKSLATLPSIIKYISNLRSADLDASLSPTEKAQRTAWAAFVEAHLGDLVVRITPPQHILALAEIIGNVTGVCILCYNRQLQRMCATCVSEQTSIASTLLPPWPP